MLACPGLIKVITNTANDFNPPLYYLILHFWIEIVGKSDEGLRILSLLFHLGGVYISYLLGEKLFNKKFAKFVALFVLLNPMLLYYAFEIRMYSLYEFLTFLTFYFFIQKDWKRYLLAAALGLYTHSFFPLLVVALVTYELVIKKSNKKEIVKILAPLLFYLPWVPVTVSQFIRSGSSWIFPVDFKLIISVLANLFTNYDGTPWYGWGITPILSIFIFSFLLLGLFKKKRESLIFILPIFLPLTFIISYSLIKSPLYVNRYLIFITVFEILGVANGIFLIKSRIIKNLSILFWIGLIVGINFYLPEFKKKTDFRSTFTEINNLATSKDYAYARTPIGLLETAYYFKNENKVFVYNPDMIKIPDYIGVTVVFPHISQSNFPLSPSRTFLINDDASYAVFINQ